jgi:TRAP-type C4-dicarboxylate transport system substrate-binding protein
MTYHNYGPTCTVMNLAVWNGLTPDQQKLVLDSGRAAQEQVRHLTESVDNLEAAKKLLEPKGMTLNAADVPAFKKLAEEKVWPKYQKQYAEMWEQIVATKV